MEIESVFLRFAADAARTEWRISTSSSYISFLHATGAMARQLHQECVGSGYCDSRVALLSNWEEGWVCMATSTTFFWTILRLVQNRQTSTLPLREQSALS